MKSKVTTAEFKAEAVEVVKDQGDLEHYRRSTATLARLLVKQREGELLNNHEMAVASILAYGADAIDLNVTPYTLEELMKRGN